MDYEFSELAMREFAKTVVGSQIMVRDGVIVGEVKSTRFAHDGNQVKVMATMELPGGERFEFPVFSLRPLPVRFMEPEDVPTDPEKAKSSWLENYTGKPVYLDDDREFVARRGVPDLANALEPFQCALAATTALRRMAAAQIPESVRRANPDKFRDGLPAPATNRAIFETVDDGPNIVIDKEN